MEVLSDMSQFHFVFSLTSSAQSIIAKFKNDVKDWNAINIIWKDFQLCYTVTSFMNAPSFISLGSGRVAREVQDEAGRDNSSPEKVRVRGQPPGTWFPQNIWIILYSQEMYFNIYHIFQSSRATRLLRV